jgi:class 3 adenylate cyclase
MQDTMQKSQAVAVSDNLSADEKQFAINTIQHIKDMNDQITSNIQKIDDQKIKYTEALNIITLVIEKIKTIGDAYLAVSGLPLADACHAENTVKAALDILAFMKARQQVLGDQTFEIRIGIHSGDVVAGIVGVKKFAYDIWGDTVNTAARMEQKSEPGKINISQTTYELVKDKFTCTYRGEIEAKNKGMMKMYFVEG